MSLFQAYLLKKSTQRILNRKIGDKGFSLIELVVVIAVLAALAAIALPNFLGISDDASVRAAQTAIVNATKECQATWARGKRGVVATDAGGIQYYNGHTPSQPAIIDVSEYKVYSWPVGIAVGSFNLIGDPGDEQMQCFAAGPAKKDLIAQPTVTGKFPVFVVRTNGKRECNSGNGTNYPDTFNIGCTGASNSAGSWQ